jgi:HlyD family secretion protein
MRILLLALIAIVAAGGALLWQFTRTEAPASMLVLYGNVDIRQVDLAFNASERVAQMLVREGDAVVQGQLLATLEMERFAQALARAEAQVEAQTEVVARLEAGTRPEEIRKALADVEAAAADARNAELNYQRVQALAKDGVATQQRADDATAAHQSAQARLKAAQETHDLAVAGPRKEDIAAAKALLKVYEAEAALARRDLANASLHAPARGVLRDRVLEPGDMASPQRPAYTLALTDPVWVRAYVAEPDLGKIWPGMAAQVTADSYPGKAYKAWIGFISPTAEFTPKAIETQQLRTRLVYQVRVFVENPQDELRLGMPATVTIDLTQPRPPQ